MLTGYDKIYHFVDFIKDPTFANSVHLALDSPYLPSIISLKLQNAYSLAGFIDDAIYVGSGDNVENLIKPHPLSNNPYGAIIQTYPNSFNTVKNTYYRRSLKHGGHLAPMWQINPLLKTKIH